MTEVFNIFKERKSVYKAGGKDSLVKVIDNYFSSVISEPFEFAGKVYNPRNIRVSTDIIRGFTCVENCGACCSDFSLDYLPFEEMPYEIATRKVKLNGKEYIVHTDWNSGKIVGKRTKTSCKHLQDNGRCGIHGKHPFSCDFELLRFVRPVDETSIVPIKFNHQLFGRKFAMQKVTGEMYAGCNMEPRTENDRKETLRKIARLQQWTKYFEIKTHLEDIYNWISIIDLTETKPLLIYNRKEKLEL